MAKNAITQYSATASENTDVGGINILGSAPVSNMDDGIRMIMAHLADMNAGTSPLDDTFTLQSAGNNNIQGRPDLTGMAATLSPLPMLPVSRACTPKYTTYTSSGTHTFLSGSTKYQIYAIGGGGAGAAAYCSTPGGGSTRYCAGTGGNSGLWGMSNIRSIAFDGDDVALTGAVTIGDGGTCNVDSSNVTTKADGGDTVWTHNAVSLTIKGGTSPTAAAVGSASIIVDYSPAPDTRSTGWLYVGQNMGGQGIGGISSGASGNGASSPFGCGGRGQAVPGSSVGNDGNAANGYGAGGAGGVALSNAGQTRTARGGAGSPGLLIVMEW